MTHPTLKEEKKLWKRGLKAVAGLDEAGRGPLAGPVTAAAVVIIDSKNFMLDGVNDSKKLSAKKREQLYGFITKNNNIAWGVGIVSEKVIDKINIKNASELAMEKAVAKLKKRPDFLIIDGNGVKNSKLKSYKLKLIVKADAKVFSVAAASILAKVTRDRIMMKYHEKYPEYRFDLHKGYPTKLHHKMIKRYGPSIIHRVSFNPISKMLKY
jgi:ribonuclease HII